MIKVMVEGRKEGERKEGGRKEERKKGRKMICSVKQGTDVDDPNKLIKSLL